MKNELMEQLNALKISAVHQHVSHICSFSVVSVLAVKMVTISQLELPSVYCRKEEGRILTVVMIPEAQAWILLVI